MAIAYCSVIQKKKNGAASFLTFLLSFLIGNTRRAQKRIQDCHEKSDMIDESKNTGNMGMTNMFNLKGYEISFKYICSLVTLIFFPKLLVALSK